MRASFADITGVQTRFFHHGAGEYGVLLLHGVGVGADSWLWNIEALGQDRMALAPDMLGYGLAGEGTYRQGAPHDGIVDHLAALIDRLGLQRVCVVGSSFGSNIACHLAMQLGSRIDRMVLVGCGPALNEPGTLHTMYQQSLANGIAAMAEPTLDRCERRLRNLVFDPASVPSALAFIQLTLYGLPDARDRYERRMRGIMSMEALERYDVTRHLHAISVPTLVIWGRQDMRGNLAEAEQHARRLPNGEMIILEECGHLPYLEKPTEFNALVDAFIRRSESSATRDGCSSAQSEGRASRDIDTVSGR
jgi:pimeloyl-ACP methyl ester carboxylesterase